MGFFQFLDKAAGRLRWYDVSMLKASIFFFTLFLVTAWNSFGNLVLGIPWYWHLLIGIAFGLPLAHKMLFK